MPHIAKITMSLLVVLLANGWLSPAYASSDVRVLIDVSGSMKKTDPNNLRKPALRLLVRLLPDDARAGVWTFGKYVSQEIKHGKVTESWRSLAERKSDAIHSRGLFTNIELAIGRATASWHGSDENTQRSLILLTDGMVDVSKDPAKSDASRARILDKLLPSLKQRNIKVLAVALSEQADHELLQALAVNTDGWYEPAATADELQRLFLRVFEKAAPADTVPLAENRFRIDKSIREMTVLVFRKVGAPVTQIVQPDGGAISNADAPTGVKWFSEDSYDLITIAEPQTGEWGINAEIDPDNRVMVITDLKMRAKELPNQISAGQGLAIQVGFFNEGEQIQKQGFLRLVSVFTEHNNPKKNSSSLLMSLDNEGVFSTEIETLAQEGEHTVVVQARSDTFVRELVHKVNVVSPVTIDLLADEDGAKYTVKVSAKPTLVDTANLQVVAFLTGPDRKKKPLLLNRESDTTWLGNIHTPENAEYKLQVGVEGRSPLGDRLHAETPNYYLYGPELAPEPPPQPAPEPEIAEAPQPEAQFNWVKIIIQLLVVNLIVGAAVFGFIWWRRRGVKSELIITGADTA